MRTRTLSHFSLLFLVEHKPYKSSSKIHIRFSQFPLGTRYLIIHSNFVCGFFFFIFSVACILFVLALKAKNQLPGIVTRYSIRELFRGTVTSRRNMTMADYGNVDALKMWLLSKWMVSVSYGHFRKVRLAFVHGKGERWKTSVTYSSSVSKTT